MTNEITRLSCLIVTGGNISTADMVEIVKNTHLLSLFIMYEKFK